MKKIGKMDGPPDRAQKDLSASAQEILKRVFHRITIKP
jgi:hypothetical protein